MGRWADIRTRVINAVGDISESEAQAFILDAARELNAETKWYEAKVDIGTTTAGTGEYDVTDTVVDFHSVLVGGVPYGPATAQDIENYDADRASIDGDGVFAPYWNSSGDLRISIRPTPTTTGTTITGRRVLRISVSDWTTEDPPFPEDFDQIVIAGAVALGLGEQDERLESAAYHRQVFDTGIRRLKSRKSGRVGKGAMQLPLPRGVRRY